MCVCVSLAVIDAGVGATVLSKRATAYDDDVADDDHHHWLFISLSGGLVCKDDRDARNKAGR